MKKTIYLKTIKFDEDLHDKIALKIKIKNKGRKKPVTFHGQVIQDLNRIYGS